ncbi:hypothetical protein ACQP3C_30905, partial [Escherichia coli]
GLAAGASWERSNITGKGEKEIDFHSCVHATSRKTAKLLQLACTQLCFLQAEDTCNEFLRFGVFENAYLLGYLYISKYQ